MICSKCLRKKPKTSFHKNPTKARGFQYNCKACQLEQSRLWKRTHPEQRKAYEKRNREKINAQKRETRAKLRKQVIEKFGSKCIQCGYDNWMGLQLDHKNGGGKKEMAQLNSTVKLMKKSLRYPSKYQLLCANCNQMKRYHQKEGVVRHYEV